MSRQDCSNRPRGSVTRLKIAANGVRDVLTAKPTLCKNVATGTTRPLWMAANKGFSIPSEMPITNPINRGRNKPAVTNLSNATKPNVMRIDIMGTANRIISKEGVKHVYRLMT